MQMNQVGYRPAKNLVRVSKPIKSGMVKESGRNSLATNIGRQIHAFF